MVGPGLGVIGDGGGEVGGQGFGTVQWLKSAGEGGDQASVSESGERGEIARTYLRRPDFSVSVY